MKKLIVTILLWVLVFAGSYAVLSIAGLIPLELVDFNGKMIDLFTVVPVSSENKDASYTQTTETHDSEIGFNESVLPIRILIEKIGVDTAVLNPETRDIATLDKFLLEGVVRYPGSGGLDDESNMFLFGHSTNWQTVHNQAFKSFNRLSELQIGDIVRIFSDSREYRYKVISVSQVNKDEALVEFSIGEKLVTLSTCDTFGKRNDRFVVTAKFIQSLPNQL